MIRYRPLPPAVTYGLLGAILVLAFMLRAWNLAQESLWLDEAHSIVQAQRWWKEIWVYEARIEANPPLYFTVLKYWIRVFGESEAAVRSLSAVLGTGVVAAIFVFGRLAGGSTLGLCAAALAATSPILVLYSRDTRGYALATVAAMVALCGALRILSIHRPSPEKASVATSALAWTAYIGGTVVAMYTHATLVLLPVIANLTFVAIWLRDPHREARTAIRWIVGNAAIVVAYLPWLPNIIGGDLAAGKFWVAAISASQAFSVVREVYGQPGLPQLQPWLDLALAGLALAALTGWKHNNAARFLALGAVVLIPLAIYLASLYQPIFIPRVLVWPLPILGLLVAAGALRAPRKWQASVVVVGLMALQLVSYAGQPGTRRPEGWRDLVQQLRQERQAGDAIVIVPSYAAMAFEYYADRDPAVVTIGLEGPIQPSPQWSYPVIAPDELAQRLASHRRFWLVVRHQPPDAAEGPVRTGIAHVVGRLMREAPAAGRHQHGQMLELYLFDRDRTG